jgi:hypothetical protein
MWAVRCADVVLVADELPHVEDGRVVETLPRLPQEKRLGIEPGLLLLGQLRQHHRLGWLKHAIETAQHGERHHLAVVGLLVVAAHPRRGVAAIRPAQENT